MITKQLTLTIALLVSVPYYAQADNDLYDKARFAVAHATTVEGFMLNGVVIPLVQENVASKLPDGALPGLTTRVRDIWSAVVAAATTAGWKKAHGYSSLIEAFVQALYAELGHVGLVEVIRQFGLQDMWSTATKKNYNRFGVGYVKALLAVAIKEVVDSCRQRFAI